MHIKLYARSVLIVTAIQTLLNVQVTLHFPCRSRSLLTDEIDLLRQNGRQDKKLRTRKILQTINGIVNGWIFVARKNERRFLIKQLRNSFAKDFDRKKNTVRRT